MAGQIKDQNTKHNLKKKHRTKKRKLGPGGKKAEMLMLIAQLVSYG